MFVNDAEQVSQEMEDLDDSTDKKPRPLLSRDDSLCTRMKNWADKDSPLARKLFPSMVFLMGTEERTSQFVRDHLPRVIFEDADFPLGLEKAVIRSFMETDAAFAKSCSIESARASGTTALTAMIFGRPCCMKERRRIESLGGFVDDGYLNGQLGVTRALDEFLIIGSDGIWDVFTAQNAVDFTRRRLQQHNDVKLCCKEIVEEALKRGATDNLTVVLVTFLLEPPLPSIIQRPRFRRSISAEGLQSLK
ncbi:putative protein phosphatase 2C 27 [Hibiscus syriacus]|uniref:PPM-type phosphatase domain-containing protein n=1 Tax=Hibiscus syriacus TaxID=106335 RepID=A0A6A3BDM7_HIBSY|nr:putative protein phosphatase 2C 27 [Hibiscus syriacus]